MCVSGKQCLCWDTRTQRAQQWGALAFVTCGWAASHHCSSTKPRGTWLLSKLVSLHFVRCLGNAARPGQRFLAIWADPFGSKVTETASSSHWSIPFLKHDDLGDVQAPICSLFHTSYSRMDYFQFLFAFLILACLWFFPLKVCRHMLLQKGKSVADFLGRVKSPTSQYWWSLWFFIYFPYWSFKVSFGNRCLAVAW